MRKKWFFIAPLALLVLAICVVIGGEVVKLLWNWLAPTLFGWRQITFWQAVGLGLLCRILFGGLAGPRGPRYGMGGRIRERMQQRMAERWDRMTPEEREKYRQGMRARWCGFAEPTGGTPSGGTK